MVETIEFKKEKQVNPNKYYWAGEIVVFRNGNEVARLPEADRLDRAMRLDIKTITGIANDFQKYMEREPTENEREFWTALLEYKKQHPTEETTG